MSFSYPQYLQESFHFSCFTAPLRPPTLSFTKRNEKKTHDYQCSRELILRTRRVDLCDNGDEADNDLLGSSGSHYAALLGRRIRKIKSNSFLSGGDVDCCGCAEPVSNVPKQQEEESFCSATETEESSCDRRER